MCRGLALCDQIKQAGQAYLCHTPEDLATCRKILRDKNIREADVSFRMLNKDDFDVKIGQCVCCVHVFVGVGVESSTHEYVCVCI